MASLELRQIVKDFGTTRVIHGVDLQVDHGEFVVFVGPSGCGKSTLLRLICGLEDASQGDVLIDGQAVTHLRAADRGLAMVFQSYALYPHMTVAQNMAFGLENIGTPQAEIQRKVGDAARLLQLDTLLQRKPTQLSGGQRQRVAIGRAIVREPKIFLFDEPLSNLDAELRVTMRAEINALHRRLGATMVYVTHDQTEAMTMADKIVVLRAGRIEQVGTPLDLYNQPANRFVAGFIGSPRMNFIPVTAGAGGSLLHATGASMAHPSWQAAPGTPLTLGIRPEHVALAPQPDAMAMTLQIGQIEQLGGHSMLQGELAGTSTPLSVQCPGQVALRVGDNVPVYLPAGVCHRFATGDGEPALRA